MWWRKVVNNVLLFLLVLMPLSSFAGKYWEVQPRLQPTHWRLLDSPVGRNASSVFLPSRLTKGLESSPVAKHRNASDPIVGIHLSNNRRVKREDISAALSKNITMILEDLLKDYDKTERPSFKQGQATKVKINILIRSMGPISEEDMNYSMDCYFRQYWRDERLGFTGLKKNTHKLSINQLSLNVKMLEKIWKPDTYFHNGLSSYLHTITRPNKLLRISEHGDITYSMRLTIKAKCPMMLKSFPMDWQSCPLVIGSFAYSADEVLYVWQLPKNKAVDYEGKLQLSQFDIMETAFRGLNYSRGNNMGTYSVLQVVIALQRHTGYFLIQIYLPCTLLVVLSWVGFWLNREATSDRVGLGITTVLTLSTIALESRTDLPKVHYATALDWFIICSFGYCIATLLEFAGVHYFTKVGSGEVFSLDEPMISTTPIPPEEEEEDEWQDVEVSEEWGPQTPMTPLNDDDTIHISSSRHTFQPPRCPHYQCEMGIPPYQQHADYIDDRCDSFSDDCTECALILQQQQQTRKIPPNCMELPLVTRSSLNGQCQMGPLPPPPPRPHTQQPLRCSTLQQGNNYRLANSYTNSSIQSQQQWKVASQNAVVRQAQTQTESKISCLTQFIYCLLANEKYRRTRQMEATRNRSTNSTSKIDSVARILFPVSFGLFNITYWFFYFQAQKPFDWDDHMLKGMLSAPKLPRAELLMGFLSISNQPF